MRCSGNDINLKRYPALARFPSPDPLGLGGGINPYVFAGNNPVNRTDPLGLDGDCTARGKEDSIEVDFPRGVDTPR